MYIFFIITLAPLGPIGCNVTNLAGDWEAVCLNVNLKGNYYAIHVIHSMAQMWPVYSLSLIPPPPKRPSYDMVTILCPILSHNHTYHVTSFHFHVLE
jgi:hypothetical protein